MLVRGFIGLYKKSLVEDKEVYGVPSRAVRIASVGDSVEPGNQNWYNIYFDSVEPMKVVDKSQKDLEELINLASSGDQEAVRERINELSLKHGSYAKSGSVQNIDVSLEWLADEYQEVTLETLEHSEAKHGVVVVTGNHMDGALKRTGIKEFSYFRQRLIALNIPFYEVGKDRLINGESEDARVYLGGHGNFRGIRIDNFETDTYGQPLNGATPLKVAFVHDPKGKGQEGMKGVLKNSGLHYVWSGHTHEDDVEFEHNGYDDEWKIVHRLGSTQGPAETELYYANSPCRTQAGYDVITGDQDYIETTIPGPILQEFGRQATLR